ncbi:hypothetical protein G6F63_015161 [Rhizopus arrhizus]|nr:hypothetical protein G6F63_015161 [Rhizopus arrhizus]
MQLRKVSDQPQSVEESLLLAGPAYRPGGGGDHSAGAGDDLLRHALLRHRPAQDLAGRAGAGTGPAGGRCDHRGGDDGHQDGTGLRPPACGQFRLGVDRVPDADRYPDHRGRLPADRHGGIEHR